MTVDGSRTDDRGPDVQFPPPLLFVAGLGGGVLLLASPGALALLPVVHLLLYRWVIAREERYLRAAFPGTYAAYCARVRRWL